MSFAEHHVEEAYERWVAGARGGVVITCEHASERLPNPWCWPATDQWIRGTHWAYDIGAAEIARQLALAMGTTTVLARFSRLLIDPNRDIGGHGLLREQAEGRPLALNTAVTAEDMSRRVEEYWRPYHRAVDDAIVASPGAMVLAMHSFTPLYDGRAREMEVGVLFDEDDRVALAIADSLRREGLTVALNEPYSGRDGMMFSAYRHASEHGRAAIELELRQDLAGDLAQHPRLVSAIQRALVHAGVAAPPE